jgi:hypothetical protein
MMTLTWGMRLANGRDALGEDHGQPAVSFQGWTHLGVDV